jgi:dipeptidyl aminopeptidase/acylaminoacyl peptidase
VQLSGVPEIPPEISERLRPYQNTRYATFADWAADGEGIYVSTRFCGVAQLHHVGRPEGMRRQLTFAAEPIRGAARRPAGDALLYSMDIGGGEFYQLYLLDPRTGRSRLLTDGHSRNMEPRWSPDGRRIAFTSTRRDGRSNDLWLMNPDHPDAAEPILEATDGSSWAVRDWHPRAPRLLLEQYRSITDSRLHILDIPSGEVVRIAGGDVGEASHYGVGFDGQGNGVFLATDREGEFTRLAHLDLATGRFETITRDIDWDVEIGELDATRRRLAFTANENGSSRLYLLDPATFRYRPVEGLPRAVISGLRFDAAGQSLGFTMDSALGPADAYSVAMSDDPLGAGELTRWTHSEIGGLDSSRFLAPEPISYESFDGRGIPAFFYDPGGAGPHPVVIHIHGGPESQSRPIFSGVFQSWIGELGVAVLDPNVRGSAGYGKSYLKLDNGMLREDSVRDIGALLDWIAVHPRLDESRVIVYGGSYGGYMVLASLVHFGDRLRAGVNIVGISNFVSFLQNTESYRRDLRRAEYGDERDPKMRAVLERISPLNNVQRIRSPLFVAQGANDPRVPLSESNQIVEAVRGNGGDVWYLIFKDEGHGFAKKSNADYFNAATMMFWDKHLR